MDHTVVDQDLRLRHLADIQSVIARLSQNSFVIRGWSVTLVSIVLGIASTRVDAPRLTALLAVVPALIFWGLDAYYLRRERLFRLLYQAVAKRLTDMGAPDVMLFDMDPSRFARDVYGFMRTMLTGHVLAIPGMLLLVTVAYAVTMG